MVNKDEKFNGDLEEELEEDYIEEDDMEEDDIDSEESEGSDDLLDSIIMSESKLPKGLFHLVTDYVAYAKEVVSDRAIPNIDGLKPSNRRILYTMKFLEKVKELTKSANIAGSTLKIHPHSDASVYATMVRMVKSSEYLNVPYLEGKGSFGKVYSATATPAAARYTEVKLDTISEELFRGMSGVDMVPSYSNDYEEPLLLPVSFPTILCNAQEGIAVGLATKIPSFNYHEVIKATIEKIEKGTIKKPLYPDFTTGGFYVKDEKEINKLMKTGKSKLKLRGRWHIEGKVIVIDEIPYITTVEDIFNSIKELPNIVDIKDETDRKGFKLTVECTTKKVVNDVIKDILKVSKLQCTFNTNIVVIIDNEPCVIGVEEVIERWIEFREKVVEKQLGIDLESLNYNIEKYDILVDLMTTEEKKENFLNTLVYKSKDESKKVLRSYYKDTEESIFDWILEKSLSSLSGIGNKQKSYLLELKGQREQLIEDIKDIRGVIVKELKALNKKYKYPRKTEITTEDYVFDKTEKVQEKAYPILVIVEGDFIKKLKATPNNLKEEGAIKCMSDAVISLMDSKGNLMRVQVEHLEFSTAREKGTYIPNYIGVEFKNPIIDVEVVRNRKKGFLFSDGYASVIDFYEWVRAKRITKVTELGVGVGYMENLVGPFRMDREYLIMLTEKGKMVIVKTDFIVKGRKARTKLKKPGKGDKVVDLCSVHETDLSKIVGDKERFMEGYRVIRNEDGFNKEEYDRVKEKNNTLNE